MADQKQALGPEDYKWLFDHLTSDNEGQRKEAQQLAGKLTPEEAQQFFDFQHAAHGASPELHREDNSLLGMPPEVAVAGGLGLANVAKSATGLIPKAVAVTKAVAVPALKEEMTRRTLESFGVPRPFAAIIGGIVAGYRGGAAAEAPADADAALRAKATQTLARTPEEITNTAIAQGRAAGAAAPVVAAPPPAVDMAGAPSTVAPEATAARLAMKTPAALSQANAEAAVWQAALKQGVERLPIADMKAAALDVQKGIAPDVALKARLSAAMDPAAELARRLGTPTEAEANAAIDARWMRGEIKTPSAPTALRMRSGK